MLLGTSWEPTASKVMVKSLEEPSTESLANEDTVRTHLLSAIPLTLNNLSVAMIIGKVTLVKSQYEQQLSIAP